MIESLPRLRGRHRVDQIGDRLRLHEIHAPVKKRAQRKFPGCGEPRTGAQRGSDDTFEQDRAAVRRDLDDVLARVPVRRRKERRDYLIDRLTALRRLASLDADSKGQEGSLFITTIVGSAVPESGRSRDCSVACVVPRELRFPSKQLAIVCRQIAHVRHRGLTRAQWIAAGQQARGYRLCVEAADADDAEAGPARGVAIATMVSSVENMRESAAPEAAATSSARGWR